MRRATRARNRADPRANGERPRVTRAQVPTCPHPIRIAGPSAH
jgi:hypothetical protein